MALKERVKKLCARLPPQGAELDRLIEIELARLGPEAAQAVIDEFIREDKLDESRRQS